jgi:hypothetical protein
LPRAGELRRAHAHDPAVFERILRARVVAMPRFPDASAPWADHRFISSDAKHGRASIN